MSMMIHSEKKIGIVTRKGKQSLWVEIDQGCSKTPSKCAVGCGGCSGGGGKQKAMITSVDPGNFPIGQKIEFQHVYLNENLVAFIVFGIPISAAFLTLLLWNVLSPASAETSVSFLSAAAALVVGFAIVSAFDSWFRTKFPSKILSAIPSEMTAKQ